MRRLFLLSMIAAFAGIGGPAYAGEHTSPGCDAETEIVPSEWLVISPVDGRGRRPFRPDAVIAKYVLDPDAPAPEAGEKLTGERGEQAWAERTTDENGQLGGGRIGYAYTEVDSPVERAMIAELRGASTLLIDGVPYAGDLYGFGWRGVPVRLAKGVNRILVTGVRGSFRLRFWEPETPLVIGTWDCTIPDYVVGQEPELLLGVLAMNVSLESPFSYLTWEETDVFWGRGHGDTEHHGDTVPPCIRPLQLEKSVLRVRIKAEPSTLEGLEKLPLPVRFTSSGAKGEGTRHVFEIPVRRPGELHRRTFLSAIDGSVQEYCVKPPGGERTGDDPMRLLLSVHGAGVQAWGQAACYPALPDFWHVAATNRRPFGFDWQDWGRTDAYEVLEHALTLSQVDRRRVYLGGHSMGGHGVWHLAANDPDGWAAIAPSAAWRSFDTYGGRPEGELRELWHAADRSSDTEFLVDNLLRIPTYILHGESDDNVPASEAYAMRDLLTEKGAPPRMHVEPGKGHWWDAKIGPGTDCLAWPGFYEMFRETQIPRSPREIDFVTVDPSVDADHFWVRVEQHLVYGTESRVRGRWIPEARSVELETDNVRRLVVTTPGWNGLETITLDGAPLEVSREQDEFAFERSGSEWKPASNLPAAQKSPRRGGTLKRAFDRRFRFVVPGGGDDRENELALQSARYHAQVWQYRANGYVKIVRDLRVSPTAVRAPSNAILFGNRDTNRDWDANVRAGCPISVRRGRASVGETVFEGDDLGVWFVYPRADDTDHLVGVLATTGPRAERLATTLAPFVSGVGYPDYVVFDASVLEKGDGGVLAAGWFDHEWKLQTEGGFRR